MVIGGFQKLSLVDFPNNLACIVFTRGCNFNCDYCHNSELLCDNYAKMNEDFIFEYLNQRKGMLNGVVITGGEPTIQKDLNEFIKRIKNLNLKVKLDTNGFKPEVIQQLINENLLDYIAMDIKTSLQKYKQVVNKDYDFNILKKSIDIIDNSGVDHEFRITLFKPKINIDDLIEISKLIKDETPLYLQNFKMSETVRNKDLTGFTDKELNEIFNITTKYHKNTILR